MASSRRSYGTQSTDPGGPRPDLRRLIEEPQFQAWDEPRRPVFDSDHDDLLLAAAADDATLDPEARAERRRRREALRKERASQRQASLREALTTICLLLIGFYALGVMLIELAFILVPLVFSRFIVFIFAPIIRLLTVRNGEPTGLPRWAAVLICLLLIFGFLLILALIIAFTVKGIISDADEYVDAFKNLSNDVVDLAERFGYTREQIIAMLPNIDIGAIALQILKTFFDTVPQIVLVLLIVVYMLLGIDIDPHNRKSKLEHLIDHQIRSYIMVYMRNSVVG